MIVLPCPLYPALATHALISVLPVGEVELVGQDVHTASEVAATTAEYFPVPQSVHGPVPVDGLYFPARQAVNAPLIGPV